MTTVSFTLPPLGAYTVPSIENVPEAPAAPPSLRSPASPPLPPPLSLPPLGSSSMLVVPPPEVEGVPALPASSSPTAEGWPAASPPTPVFAGFESESAPLQLAIATDARRAPKTMICFMRWDHLRELPATLAILGLPPRIDLAATRYGKE